MNKKNQKRVAKFRSLVNAGRIREACDYYHDEAVDHAVWRMQALDRLRAQRASNPKARMHPSTRRNINDDSAALRIMRQTVDPENTFGHAADLLRIP